MESFEGCVEPFVVSGEAAEACGPGEGSFHHPAAWQQDKTSFGHGMFDHFQAQAVLLCGFCGVGSGVA